MPYRFDWAPIWANRDLIVDGLLMTIALSTLGLCLALIVGVIVGTAGASARRSHRIKDSSLAYVITGAELTYQAFAIEGQTFRTFEIYITISLLYLALVTAVTNALLLIPGTGEQPVQGLSDA